jgi:hypothetical protein
MKNYKFAVEITRAYDDNVDVEKKVADMARLMQAIYDVYEADSLELINVSEAFGDKVKDKMIENAVKWCRL